LVNINKVEKEEIPYELLFLADSDEDQIKKYINESVFFASFIKNEIVGIIGLKELNDEKIEIVCIAVYEKMQNQSLGKHLIGKAIEYSKNKKYKEIIIKTGNCGIKQIKLYMKCGFRMHKIVPDYFIKNYKFPIYEEDIQCVDQIQLNYRIYSEEELKILIEEYWDNFIKKNPGYVNSKYETWSFGYGDYQANKLIGYVKQGIKTGTSSAHDLYDETEKKPEKNEISIITYGNGVPGCIIKTIEIRNKKFHEINEEEAKSEGEGKLTLDYWREVHEHFFRKEYDEMGKEFSYNIPVIYEKFELIFDDDIKQ
jgi:uncharacterized protein YhfF/ribosomal protein S18 acetylase RimI-like enzyme